jgi:protein-L-isoaspartate(D-aspartate) O-methyltransferase
MTTRTSLTEYKQQVTAFFDARTSYDNEFTYRRAIPIVELAQLQRGQQVLDVATGTGILAIAAAQLVGSEGKVVGVDISPGMLNQARRKIEAAGLQNIELIEVDADYLNFSDDSFDAIFCATAIVLLSNIPAALQSWYRWAQKTVELSPFPVGLQHHFLRLSLLKSAPSTAFRCQIFTNRLEIPEKCYTLLQE